MTRLNPAEGIALQPAMSPTAPAETPVAWLHVLQSIADEVRLLLGAHQAVVTLTGDATMHAGTVISLSARYADWQMPQISANGFAVDAPRFPVAAPVRLSQHELASHPAMRAFAEAACCRPPLYGLLTAPLHNSDGRAIGTIEVTEKADGEFSEEDECRLASFARLAAITLENARLYQATVAEPAESASAAKLIVLQTDIGKILLQKIELKELLQACVETIAGRLGVAVCRLWAGRAGVLELQAGAGMSLKAQDDRGRVPAGHFTITHVAQTRKPYLTNCIARDPFLHGKEWCGRAGLSAFAGFPLACDGRLLGVLALFDAKPISLAAFDAVAALAPLIALGIQRERGTDETDLFAAPSDEPAGADWHTEHAVIVTGADGAILDWNTGAEDCFGFRRGEMIGRALTVLVPPDGAGQHDEIMAAVARGETVSRPELIRLKRGGEPIRVSLTASPLHDTQGRVIGAVLVYHDLVALLGLEHRHHQAQKMAVFGQLAGGVAHDFNNLLTIILGYTEIMLTRLAPTDSMRELLGEIQKASRRAETLTRQLLAFSRKQTLEPKVLDLNAVLSDTEKMLRRLIGEDILMTTILAPTLQRVKIDPGHLQQIILNLAVNARDAMPAGGRLTLVTENLCLGQRQLSGHQGAEPGDYVLFSVRDSGVGMDDGVKNRLFEPLFTTKGPGKGTGLGLATVHSIVRRAGGFIDVESALGHGTTFKVYFPAVVDPAPIGGSNPHLRTIPRGSETVLLVEDDDTVRTLVQQVLLACGYTVLEATNGREALDLVDGYEAEIHLLVSDVVMPYLGGRPFAERVLALKPHVKVLFLSGYTNDAITRHGLGGSEFAFLQKPFSTSALAQKVREVLDKPASPEFRGGGYEK